jgi:hypothetical protein
MQENDFLFFPGHPLSRAIGDPPEAKQPVGGDHVLAEDETAWVAWLYTDFELAMVFRASSEAGMLIRRDKKTGVPDTPLN